MSRVQAATGASAEEMAKLTKLAKDAAASSGFSNVETADALTNLAKAGADANQAMAALPGVIALAQAGEVGLAESSEYLTKIMAAMGGEFSDAGKYADVLAEPGAADLSVHVDFEALGSVATKAGLAIQPLATQGDWLVRMGINERARALSGANPLLAGDIAAARDRLVNPEQMGELFKVFCAASPGLAPPGFTQ